MDANLFEIILDIEKSRSKFLDTRNLKTKSNTLSELWSKTVENSILENLIEMAKITHLLFMRYRDEYIKTQDDPSGRMENLDQYLEDNIEFSLDLLLLLKMQKEFLQNTTENGNDEKILDALITIEENYNEIYNFYVEFPAIQSRSKLNSRFKLIEGYNSNYRLSQALKKYQSEDMEKLMELDISRGKYYLQTLHDVFDENSKGFWFDDLILSKFVNTKVIEILDPLIGHQTENNFELQTNLERLQLIELPRAKAQSTLATAKLIIKIAKKKLNSFDLHDALIDMKSGLYELEKVLNLIGSNTQSNLIQTVFQETQSLLEYSSLLTLLIELNLEIKKLITYCKDEDLQNVREVNLKIKKLLKSYSYGLDVQYLSAIPPIYDNISATVDIILENETMINKIPEKINHNFENMERRIITATSQIVESFSKITSDNDQQDTLTYINNVLEQVEILQLTNSLMPEHIPSKNHNNNRLKILDTLATSLQYELRAYYQSDTNKIKELIHKTRAYHYANQAYFEFNNLGTKDVPIDRIKAQYSGSFISSNRLQIELYLSISQFLALNDVLPTLYMAMSFNHGENEEEAEKIMSSWGKRFEKINLFQNLLDQIVRSSNILQEHRQIHGSIVGGINWEKIVLIENQAKGCNQFVTALRELLLGSVSLKLELKEDAVIHFTEAKRMGYKAADTLQPLTTVDPELKEIPTYVFNFAKYAQESATNLDNHDLMDLPITGAFKLFRDLLFAM